MSAFARLYGVEKVKNTEKFHAFALQWCDDHNYVCDIHLDSLAKVDTYFRKIYEDWEK
jgi:hypothetical protein